MPAARTAFTSERFGNLLRDIVGSRITAQALPEFVVDDQAALRLTLAGAHLLGIATARTIAGAEPLASTDRAVAIAIVAPTIQQYLTGKLPN
ncbi:hypothetical protein ACIGKQ_20985 [Gordonia sp. NPDC062954]|uniref:TetR/AcrR family transcriptional regulator n=1 Tax=Gordonia sp. NPDC062954 TaxID=3364003 RepID=UPI0037CBAB62